MSRRIDLADRVYGRLTVLDRSPTDARFWRCRCVCGRERYIYRGNLRPGGTESCGCIHREMMQRRNTTHGRAKTPEYRAWAEMKKRCLRPTSKAFKDYGGRGIQVCAEWVHDFQAFLSHVGSRPSSRYTLGRIDNNGHYEPGNVRWETARQQGSNKRSNRLLTFRGQTKPLAEWARTVKMGRLALLKRLLRGWSVERTLTTPIRAKRAVRE